MTAEPYPWRGKSRRRGNDFGSGHSVTHGAARKLDADVNIVNVGLELPVDGIEGVRDEHRARGAHFFAMQPAIVPKKTWKRP